VPELFACWNFLDWDKGTPRGTSNAASAFDDAMKSKNITLTDINLKIEFMLAGLVSYNVCYGELISTVLFRHFLLRCSFSAS
jgi:hypothetical protein